MEINNPPRPFNLTFDPVAGYLCAGDTNEFLLAAPTPRLLLSALLFVPLRCSGGKAVSGGGGLTLASAMHRGVKPTGPHLQRLVTLLSHSRGRGPDPPFQVE